MVKRFKVKCADQNCDANSDMVLASDYAALAAELEECIGNCADPKDKRRIRELEAALQRIVDADGDDEYRPRMIAREVLARSTDKDVK